jgi:hypothetical protein
MTIDLKIFVQGWTRNAEWGERREPIRGQVFQIVIGPDGKSLQVVVNRETALRTFGSYKFEGMDKAKETAWYDIRPFLHSLPDDSLQY